MVYGCSTQRGEREREAKKPAHIARASALSPDGGKVAKEMRKSHSLIFFLGVRREKTRLSPRAFPPLFHAAHPSCRLARTYLHTHAMGDEEAKVR